MRKDIRVMKQMTKAVEKLRIAKQKVENKMKRGLETPQAIMKAGRPGGMILCNLLGAQFLYGGVLESMLHLHSVPGILLSVLLMAAMSEILGLLLRIVFGAKSRSRAYFMTAFIMIFLNNAVANQGNTIVPALVMCFSMTLACDVFGRAVWGVITSKNVTNAFVDTGLGISFVLIVAFAVFFHIDSFGESRVDFYRVENVVPDACEDAGSQNKELVSTFANEFANGSAKVKTIEYGPDAQELHTDTIDLTNVVHEGGIVQSIVSAVSDYDFAKTPIAGKIYYPEEGTSCPTLFIVHGMHDSAVPSYLGYDYLGEYLASYGYVVVSVDQNIINSLEATNDIRAILLLDTISALLQENENRNSPVFHKINPDKLAIAGHSRGGEMVATAYLFNNLEAYPDDGTVAFDYHFSISSVVAIAPTVDQYMPANHAVKMEDVNYLLLHGANDQDVSMVMGEKQYNNVTFTGTKDCFKASVYINGANHGQFNTQWGRYDLNKGTNGFLNTNHFITAEEQQRIAKIYVRTFLDNTLQQDASYKELFSDNAVYRKYLPDTEYITNYSSSKGRAICTFDNSPDLMSETKITCQDIKRWKTRADKHGNGGDGENYVLECSWNENTNPVLIFKVPDDKSSFTKLYFRMADMREDIEEESESVFYKVILKDNNGNQLSFDEPVLVYPSLALQLYKQDIFTGNYEYKHQFQTVAIDLSVEQLPKGFDRNHISEIQIAFDGTKKGSIKLDDVMIEE